MKRAASIAGLSLVAFVGIGPTTAAAFSAEPDQRFFRLFPSARPAAEKPAVRPAERPPSRKADQAKADRKPVIPPGPLHIIVSIDKQRVTLFADGKPVTSSPISSGTPDHPTPMGVFSVIQKRRHHISNLYNAPMPFMQRLTWSGTAMHQGPLPGRPASHGCVRLTGDFAELLWKTTRIGARVIVTRDEVAPTEIDLPNLFARKPKIAAAPPAPAPLIKTADATGLVPGAAVRDANRPTAVAQAAVPVAEPAPADLAKPEPDRPLKTETAGNAQAPEQPTKLSDLASGSALVATAAGTATAERAAAVDVPMIEPAPINFDFAKSDVTKPAPAQAQPVPVMQERPVAIEPPVVREVKKSTDPVSVFVSRKEGKLYVRQKMAPLFDMPVSITNADQPIGTHVYTVMAMDNDRLRWTVISIPSTTKRAADNKKADEGRKTKSIRPAAVQAVPLPDAREAIARIVMPPEVVERIAELVIPGSSLIISDNKLSDETGEYTDLIVLTP